MKRSVWFPRFFFLLGICKLSQRAQGLVLLRLQPPHICVSRRDGLWRSICACCGITITTAATTTAATTALLLPSPRASAMDTPSSLVEGRVELAPDAIIESSVEKEESRQTNALYITVRPNRADNVPAAILSGTRGKPPPILAARYENPTFPFEFRLTEADLTFEGANVGGEEPYWWARQDDDGVDDTWIVSGRWDYDGIAVTRSPEDLVGRTTVSRNSRGNSVTIQLHGRGSFGKFATKKK